MKNLQTPFRYDFVGSFLRPEELKKARTEFEAGKITAEELRAVEDTCILKLVEKQKAAGSQMENSAELHGTLILCGDFRESDIPKQKQDCHSTGKQL